MKKLILETLTTIILVGMILASMSISIAAAQEPSLQAQPLFCVSATGINPNALGPYNPYYSPSDIKHAYNLPLTGGSGTIAIIDAYSDPQIQTDLSTFSAQWNLAPARLEIHPMSPMIQSNPQWAVEESIDVELAHAIAPNARILLVEANSESLTNLLAAVNYARNRPDVVAISMSWGSNEFLGQTAFDSYFTSIYGASFFASSGDVGGVVSWPSSSVNVISVGGTTLSQTANGYTETAWSDSGGGVSAYEPIPTFQASVDRSLSFTNRATPDVSYDANPATGFLIFDSYGYEGYSGWLAIGGTSVGAPQWAAIQALGKSATNSNFYADYPQSYGIHFNDITSGSSGNYNAIQGYDLATGIGSPLGADFKCNWHLTCQFYP